MCVSIMNLVGNFFIGLVLVFIISFFVCVVILVGVG